MKGDVTMKKYYLKVVGENGNMITLFVEESRYKNS